MVRLLFFFLLALSPALHAQVTVPTSEGPVVGYAADSLVSFKGIPYAQAPLADLRWRPPQAPLMHPQPFDARDFGAMCPQFVKASGKRQVSGSEDCLKLNVWKPQKASNLPVMVFLHGGANVVGAGNADPFANGSNLYDGAYLASLGAVIVTLNYRLGAFGFMAHPALSAESGYAGSGNYGILDQIQALRWIQQNIKNFGGDPANVTVFGESAGAIDTLGLISSPLAQGLFSRAIVESGFLTETSLEVSEKLGTQVAKKLGCPAPNVLNCLRSRSASEVLEANGSDDQGKLVGANLTIDGYVLKTGILKAFQQGRYNHVPVIIGSNADEMTTLAPALTDIPQTPAAFERTIKTYFGERTGALVIAHYPAFSYGFPARTFEVLMGDAFVHCPTRQITRTLNNQGTPVWRYVFSHVSDNPLFAPFGAGHALELPYVFHLESFFASGREERLSQTIAGAWKTFATTGQPPGELNWPRSQSDEYLNLDVDLSRDQNFRGMHCDFWDTLLSSP